ncbi:hypothetical protein LOTGIDRAFT_165081 [Lottia gigantea]|uniref:Uncharacterized protein n=1 Tax=Lottia gigantea TaxID=225164 RepID=V4BLG2_LOTGI|nr:hypothetical protein LOTGIDRAFT_165081 [Lottia gigantea]ESO89489.1 hypothetical protein LOTGIDRAFT_165081 [Lottia gigantea]
MAIKSERTAISKLIFVIILTFSTVLKVNCTKPEILSIVQDNQKLVNQEFVKIVNPPNELDSTTLLTLEYSCLQHSIVGTEVQILYADNKTTRTYTKFWKCTQPTPLRKRRIRIRLPNSVSFKPSRLNRAVVLVNSAKLRAWIITKEQLQQAKQNGDVFSAAKTKVFYDVKIPDVFSRKHIRPWRACKIWYWNILCKMPVTWSQSCPVERETIRAVTYPAAMNGLGYGIYRSFKPYRNPDLEAERRNSITKPTFTVSMWLYINKYCPYGKYSQKRKFCSLMTAGNWDTSLTPALIVLDDGTFQLEVFLADKKNYAMKPPFKLPQHQWFRLTLNFQHRSWLITLNYGKNWNQTSVTQYTYGQDVIMDDTDGYVAFGGDNKRFTTFVGYIGETVYYRGQWIQPEKIPYPSLKHPMFQLDLTPREERCSNFITWIESRVKHYSKLKNTVRKDVCYSSFYEIRRSVTKNLQNKTCPISRDHRSRYYRIINSYIRRIVFGGQTLSPKNMPDVATHLYNNATAIIDEKLSRIPRAVPLLKQSSCLGNTDAMFMLAVILNNGIYFKSDQIQSQAYLMMASMEGHRLATMALGNKHMIGIDGVPYDREHSYLYYNYVADKTRQDIDAHKNHNVLTESVRLTDEAKLQQQTDEEGDIFLWLKHQAQAGVLSAQRNIGKTLFWGQNGVKRNIDAAMNYFKAGAEQQDPEAMYDYGILLYKGTGSKKNETEGKKIVEKAAAQMNPNAITALGWIALERERNYTKAYNLLIQAYQKRIPDAGYYLGYMAMNGKIPNEPADLLKAKQYMSFAASKGHVDAGVWFAYMCMKGSKVLSRDVTGASDERTLHEIHLVLTLSGNFKISYNSHNYWDQGALCGRWARHLSEQNPALGNILHKALHAWRRLDIPQALFYYLMTAETGSEIGAFNTAYLCEENKEGITHYIEKECQWRHYNISIQRELHIINSYGKMNE